MAIATKQDERVPQATPLKGAIVIRDIAELDEIETELLEAQFSGGTEAGEAYLYVIQPSEDNRIPKPIIGPTTDFKKQMVNRLNSTGRVELTLLDEPPIVADVIIDDVSYVRAIVGSVDRKTGLKYWAVKEERRRKGGHAATIALEKAQGKALEGHPSYNRPMVNRYIKQYLKRQGLDPNAFLIAGTGSTEWARLFGKAKAAGVSPDAVRKRVREKVGAGLSELETVAQVSQAAEAVDDLVDEATTVRIETLTTKCKEYIKQLGLSKETVRWLWGELGSKDSTEKDFAQTLTALELIAGGANPKDAVKLAREKEPK